MNFGNSLGRTVLCAFACGMTAAAFPVNTAQWVQIGDAKYPEGHYRFLGDAAENYYGPHRAGVFGLQYAATYHGAYQDFQAICIDANQNLFEGKQLYFIEDLASYTAIQPESSPNTPQLTAAQRTSLGQLFTIGWQDVLSTAGTVERARKSAAFQWAAWNIAGDADRRLDAGTVRITDPLYAAQEDMDAVILQANTYLSLLTPQTPVTGLQIWSPVERVAVADGFEYRRVYGQELLVPAPEPGFLLLLAAGVVAVGWRARARRGVATPESGDGLST